MKVFWLAKYTDEKNLQLYRCIKEPENIYSLNIKEDVLFDYLAITNPLNGNLIYIIHYLNFKADDTDTLTLYMADSININSITNQSKPLEIRCLDSMTYGLELIELSTISSSYQLLNSNYLILLPGGSIIIKPNQSISKAHLDIKYTTEEL